jgi:hypothetical protein
MDQRSLTSDPFPIAPVAEARRVFAGEPASHKPRPKYFIKQY